MGSMDYCLVENTLSEVKRIVNKVDYCQKFSKSEASRMKELVNIMFDFMSNYDLIDFDEQCLDNESVESFIEELGNSKDEDY